MVDEHIANDLQDELDKAQIILAYVLYMSGEQGVTIPAGAELPEGASIEVTQDEETGDVTAKLVTP